MAHITGGGLPENVPRSLAPGQSVRLIPHSWPILPEFRWLQEQGEVATVEMFRTFNLGVGFVLIVAPEHRDWAECLFPEALEIGEVVAGNGEVLGLESWDSL
jgi:phosphoribosylformylglycinamidine cyclo-ligase